MAAAEETQPIFKEFLRLISDPKNTLEYDHDNGSRGAGWKTHGHTYDDLTEKLNSERFLVDALGGLFRVKKGRSWRKDYILLGKDAHGELPDPLLLFAVDPAQHGEIADAIDPQGPGDKIVDGEVISSKAFYDAVARVLPAGKGNNDAKLLTIFGVGWGEQKRSKEVMPRIALTVLPGGGGSAKVSVGSGEGAESTWYKTKDAGDNAAANAKAFKDHFGPAASTDEPTTPMEETGGATTPKDSATAAALAKLYSKDTSGARRLQILLRSGQVTTQVPSLDTADVAALRATIDKAYLVFLKDRIRKLHATFSDEFDEDIDEARVQNMLVPEKIAKIDVLAASVLDTITSLDGIFKVARGSDPGVDATTSTDLIKILLILTKVAKVAADAKATVLVEESREDAEKAAEKAATEMRSLEEGFATAMANLEAAESEAEETNAKVKNLESTNARLKLQLQRCDAEVVKLNRRLQDMPAGTPASAAMPAPAARDVLRRSTGHVTPDAAAEAAAAATGRSDAPKQGFTPAGSFVTSDPGKLASLEAELAVEKANLESSTKKRKPAILDRITALEGKILLERGGGGPHQPGARSAEDDGGQGPPKKPRTNAKLHAALVGASRGLLRASGLPSPSEAHVLSTAAAILALTDPDATARTAAEAAIDATDARLTTASSANSATPLDDHVLGCMAPVRGTLDATLLPHGKRAAALAHTIALAAHAVPALAWREQQEEARGNAALNSSAGTTPATLDLHALLAAAPHTPALTLDAATTGAIPHALMHAASSVLPTPQETGCPKSRSARTKRGGVRFAVTRLEATMRAEGILLSGDAALRAAQASVTVRACPGGGAYGTPTVVVGVKVVAGRGSESDGDEDCSYDSDSDGYADLHPVMRTTWAGPSSLAARMRFKPSSSAEDSAEVLARELRASAFCPDTYGDRFAPLQAPTKEGVLVSDVVTKYFPTMMGTRKYPCTAASVLVMEALMTNNLLDVRAGAEDAEGPCDLTGRRGDCVTVVFTSVCARTDAASSTGVKIKLRQNCFSVDVNVAPILLALYALRMQLSTSGATRVASYRSRNMPYVNSLRAALGIVE